MAQLPPKVPNVVPQNHHHHHNHPQHQQEQWQDFMHPHHHQHHGQNPPWVDEFIEFSAARRGVHRRSASESSVAFVEAGPVPFFHPQEVTGRGTKANMNDNNDQFDKFDDEQFMSMFSNELGGPSSSNPSSTSDHNSTNDDQKRETTVKRRETGGPEKAEEVESTCKTEKDEGQVQVQVQAQGGGEGSHSKGGNNVTIATPSGNNAGGVDNEQQPVVDPKRVKRILANRQSAQRSRVRKLQYISELERSVNALQSEVSALSPRVAFLDHQRMILNVDNSTLKAKIAALAQDKIFKDAHQEAMKREIERLRQVYYQQNMNKTESIVPPPSTSSLLPRTSQPTPPDTTVNENEHHNS